MHFTSDKKTIVEPPNVPLVPLFDLPVVNTDANGIVAWLSHRVATGKQTRVAFLNAHCANVAARNPAYREALVSADAILPDGSGVALAMRMHGQRLVANLNGTDLIPLLCRQFAASGTSVYLLGGKPGVAEAAAASLVRSAPGLIIAGSHDGFFAPNEEQGVIDRINASGADVVLVAMGVPVQDEWLHRVAPRLQATLTFGVGGLFDFLSGRIPRAPRPLRLAGLEWTWRLYQEPARMWRRYILGNPEFVARAAVDALPSRAAVLRRVDTLLRRAIDVIVASLGLALLAPVLAIIFALVRLTSPGPALLRQTRVGENGVEFGLYKFRSMYVDAEARRAALTAGNQHGANGVTFKMRRDPRVTPFGRLLRRSSIDELPQLWNVLKGDMSLVGPRPPLPAEVLNYTPAQRRRLAGKPGLTCLWQISGRADLPFEKQVELDIAYLTQRSVLMDLSILLRTVPAVLTARGAY
ncbi:MAG: WecB/TagA/CpsF family glycosyltransferase [Proteobacteria bacterium]|nr:WecB/TagA/CpsF family glycosyltransferase [Pseudomonadota bacterium]